MRSHILPRVAPKRAREGFSFSGFLHRFILAAALRRDRKRLALLDDHLLKDIGISRETALREASRKGWGASDHWIR